MWRPSTCIPPLTITKPAATISAEIARILPALTMCWCQSWPGTDSNSAPIGNGDHDDQEEPRERVEADVAADVRPRERPLHASLEDRHRRSA